jgi:hypothetical protein
MFIALAIKDFHVDGGSFMDAMAPSRDSGRRRAQKTDRTKLPGWADIQV